MVPVDPIAIRRPPTPAGRRARAPARLATLILLCASLPADRGTSRAAAQPVDEPGRAGQNQDELKRSPADATPAITAGDSAVAVRVEPQRRADGRFSFDAFVPTSAEIPSAPAMALQYEARGWWQTNVSEQDAQFAMMEHDLRLAAPIARDETEQWLATLRLRAVDIEGAARLPDTGDRLPDALYDPRIGLRYTRRLTNDWMVGIDGYIGSPGDKPCASLDEIAINVTAFARIPHGDRNAWHAYVNFANTRDFANYVPLPGVGYEFHTDMGLDGLVGVPFTWLSYRPEVRLSLRANYLIPRNIDAEAAWSLGDCGELFGGYEWDNSRWFRHDRDDDDDALTYHEQRVKAGWRYSVDGVSLELEGGYSFDRFWFEAEEYEDRGENRINVGDGPYLMLQVRVEL